MPVGDAAGLAIADMVLGQQIVFVGLEMSAVGSRGIPITPLARQLEFCVYS
jgi:hypothetical protein